MKRNIIVVTLFVITFFHLFACENKVKPILLSFDMQMDDAYELLGKPKKTILTLDTINDDSDIYRDIYDGIVIHYCKGMKNIYELYIYDSKFKLLISGKDLIIGETKQQVEEKFGEGLFFYKDKFNQYVYRYKLPPFFIDDMFLECYYDNDFSLCGLFIGAQSDGVGCNWTRYE
ncbi:MAG: hypothetical protein IKZ86_06055 [Spirochaetaceae bacterium]|nr:hypothetical protein [Spirochaetaceae bacterium]